MKYFRSESNLNLRIKDAVARKRSSLSLAYEPDADFLRVIEAGRVLQWNPYGEPLADKKIAKNRKATFLQDVFRTIVNDSLDPLPNSDFTRRSNSAYEGTCIGAEQYLAELLSYMQPGKHMPVTVGGRLIIKDNEPVMLQKSQGNRTALTLRELVVDGVRWPKGMLFGVHVEADREDNSNRFYFTGTPGSITVAEADEVVGVDPLRPSMYALPPKERTPYYADRIWIPAIKGSQEYTSELLQHKSIDDIIGQVATYASLTTDSIS